MKKIFLSSIALLAFSLSIILFQISCKKSAVAASNATTTSTDQNKLLYLKEFYGNSSTQLFDYAEIWTANADGSSPLKLNITLPTNVVIALTDPKVSRDGKTIFFNAFLTDGTHQISNNWSIYACNIDGSNVRQILSDASKALVQGDTY
ncbi:MAG TPA: hypothetical protein VK671_05500 [Mucilaginibacter sp.]|nr:hypothetical protein [Mucilaginibacter sp.]